MWWAWLIIGLVALFIIGGWDCIDGGGDDYIDDGDGDDVGDGGGDDDAGDDDNEIICLLLPSWEDDIIWFLITVAMSFSMIMTTMMIPWGL